jgi:hypothetical protein
MNKFDKPFRPMPFYDKRLGNELFASAESLDTHELLQFSLKNHIPLDYNNDDGETLIHRIVRIDNSKANQHSKLNVIKFLVQNGVNPDKPDKSNNTPLHYACSLQLDLIVKYLLELGANPNYTDNNGYTPFHYTLTGEIKPISKTSKVFDFIPPPKKEDPKKKEQLSEIAIQLNTLLENEITENKLPIYKTIEQTIDKLIEYDDHIKNNRGIILKNINRLATSAESKDPLPEIKENIFTGQNSIKRKLEKYFGNFNKFDNFEIHEKKNTSWAPSDYGTESLIKDGKIKKVIGNEIKSMKTNIENLTFNSFPTIPQNNENNDFENMFINFYINNFENEPSELRGGRRGETRIQRLIRGDNNSPLIFNDRFTPALYSGQNNDRNGRFRFDKVPDNASSYLDFKRLVYVGGPRDMEVIYPNSFIDDVKTVLQGDIAVAGANWIDSNLILYMLGSPLPLGQINTWALNGNGCLLDNLADLDFGRDFIPTNGVQPRQNSQNRGEKYTHINDGINLSIRTYNAFDNYSDYYCDQAIANYNTFIGGRQIQALGLAPAPAPAPAKPTPLTPVGLIAFITQLELQYRQLYVANVNNIINAYNIRLAGLPLGIAPIIIPPSPINRTELVNFVNQINNILANKIQEEGDAILNHLETLLINEHQAVVGAGAVPPLNIRPRPILNNFTQAEINIYQLAVNNEIAHLRRQYRNLLNNFTRNPLRQIYDFQPFERPVDAVIDITDLLNNNLAQDMIFYLILAHTAILYPNRFNEIARLNAHNINYRNSPFAQKWFALKNNSNISIGSWLFNMWSDVICKISDSNLCGYIPFRLLMLISGLESMENQQGINYKQCIVSSYKPFLINELFNSNNVDTTKLSQYMMLLLNDNITINFIGGTPGINQPLADDTALDAIANRPNDNDIMKFIKLCYYYSRNQNLDNANKNIAGSNDLYDFYTLYENSPGDKIDKQVLIKIFIELINKIKYKPNKQTIIDTIYFMSKFNPSINIAVSTNDFKKISTYQLINIQLGQAGAPPGTFPLNQNISSENEQPSSYSIKNYDEQTILQTNHLSVAHILGLYYEGTFYSIRYNDLTQPIGGVNLAHFDFIPAPGGPPGAIIPDPNDPIDFHGLNGDVLEDFNLPLPLNFILLNPNNRNVNNVLTPIAKNTFYDASRINFEMRLPSIHGYFMMLITKIKKYQDEITNLYNRAVDIITQIVDRGNSSNLGQLYTDIYPRITILCKLLNSFTESYNLLIRNNSIQRYNTAMRDNIFTRFNNPQTFNFIELARCLNIINANYYLYYYLFAPNKVIKLSRFNFYQIPINQDNYNLYFNYNPSNLVNILNEDVIPASNKRERELDIDGILNRNIYITNKIQGKIGNYSFGNYNRFLEEIKTGIPNNIITLPGHFIRYKESPLPPSLYASLDKFYKYSIIEIVRKIIENIHQNKTNNGIPKNIYDSISKLISDTMYSIQTTDLSKYIIIATLLDQIIRGRIEVLILNSSIKKYEEFISQNPILSPMKEEFKNIIPVKEFGVSLAKLDLDNLNITQKELVKNLYSPVIQPNKKDIFILYPNDFANTFPLNAKQGISINKNIINKLMEQGASIYSNSYDNNTPITLALKNKNYKIFEYLKIQGIDFRDFNNNPIEYINQEIKDNIDKLFNNYNIGKDNLEKLLYNIDDHMYQDVYNLIISNEVFGNNVLINLKEGFHLSTYLTLQYLFEHIINISSEFKLEDCYEILNLLGFNISDINKNYLGENLLKYNVPNDPDILIIQEILKTKNEEFKLIEKEKINNDQILNQLQKTNPELFKKSKKSDIRLQNINRYNILKKEIKSLKYLMRINPRKFNDTSKIDNKIIKRYNNLFNDNYNLAIYAWRQLFNTQLDNDNYNMGLIKLLNIQKDVLDKPQKTEFQSILKIMSHISSLAEEYFETDKYKEENRVLRFLDDKLNYITKLVIGQGIELFIRRILFTYFNNIETETNIDTKLEIINAKINSLFEGTLIGINKSLKDLLYDDVCPKLVKNSAKIFDNNAEKIGDITQSTNEILYNFILFIDNSPILLSEEVKNILKKDVINYFDNFTSRTINLLYVNFENILKFFINNYRCLKTLSTLVL